MGLPEHPFDKLFWFNEVEKLLFGSAQDTYVAARSCIFAMTVHFLEHEAVARVAHARSRPPSYDADINKFT